jgi:hypothetical protein
MILFETNKTKSRGNCLVSCLASLVNLNVEQIPCFEDLPKGEWKYALPKWLFYRGYQLVKRKSPRLNGQYCIGVGFYNGGRHAMIFLDGKPFHDPAKVSDHRTPIVRMDMEYYFYIDKIEQ